MHRGSVLVSLKPIRIVEVLIRDHREGGASRWSRNHNFFVAGEKNGGKFKQPWTFDWLERNGGHTHKKLQKQFCLEELQKTQKNKTELKKRSFCFSTSMSSSSMSMSSSCRRTRNWLDKNFFSRGAFDAEEAKADFLREEIERKRERERERKRERPR